MQFIDFVRGQCMAVLGDVLKEALRDRTQVVIALEVSAVRGGVGSDITIIDGLALIIQHTLGSLVAGVAEDVGRVLGPGLVVEAEPVFEGAGADEVVGALELTVHLAGLLVEQVAECAGIRIGFWLNNKW